ncbi:hypothetical protein [Fodinicola acaciae]|uniref:hypothetical protein n=1 Tax=Fodinicola acaciae TaxID=2681555 RepID=UPI0013D2630C|nr:hypothetical protein [Fodinicola acaciae]
MTRTAPALVVTEFSCANRLAWIRLIARFRWHGKAIMAGVSGLQEAYLVVRWRECRVVHVSRWSSTEATYTLGHSRRHVETVRWVIRCRHITATSVLYESPGTYRATAVRDRGVSSGRSIPL